MVVHAILCAGQFGQIPGGNLPFFPVFMYRSAGFIYETVFENRLIFKPGCSFGLWRTALHP